MPKKKKKKTPPAPQIDCKEWYHDDDYNLLEFKCAENNVCIKVLREKSTGRVYGRPFPFKEEDLANAYAKYCKREYNMARADRVHQMSFYERYIVKKIKTLLTAHEKNIARSEALMKHYQSAPSTFKMGRKRKK